MLQFAFSSFIHCMPLFTKFRRMQLFLWNLLGLVQDLSTDINTHRCSSPLSKMAWYLFILQITYCVRLSISISNMRTVIEENIYFGSLSIQSSTVLILDPCAERQNIIVQNGVCSRKYCYSTQEKSWGWEAENSVCMETRRTRETIVPRI